MGRIDFVRLKRDAAFDKKKRELPQKPSQKQQQPDAPKMQMPSGGGADAISVAAPEATVDAHKVDLGGLNLGGAPSDTDAVPVVRVEPIYPPYAQQRGLEGWVLVEFDIGPSGNVHNPKVLESNPARIFDEAAIQTIRKWKYKPQVKDGKPLTTRGLSVKIVFKLEK
jgi:protein TonB